MIDRSDAVNLARNLVERDIDWDVAPPGVKCLADAVLAMDEYIRSGEAPGEGRWYFTYESESEADARERRSACLAFGNLEIGAAVSPLMQRGRSDGDGK